MTISIRILIDGIEEIKEKLLYHDNNSLSILEFEEMLREDLKEIMRGD